MSTSNWYPRRRNQGGDWRTERRKKCGMAPEQMPPKSSAVQASPVQVSLLRNYSLIRSIPSSGLYANYVAGTVPAYVSSKVRRRELRS